MIHENRDCATCGAPHDKGTYDHRYVRRVVFNSLDLIAPGQRLPYMRGAAVAFGLMGMAEAIGARIHNCPECHHRHERTGPCGIGLILRSLPDDDDADFDVEPFI